VEGKLMLCPLSVDEIELRLMSLSVMVGDHPY
jgi:hypothetical protein